MSTEKKKDSYQISPLKHCLGPIRSVDRKQLKNCVAGEYYLHRDARFFICLKEGFISSISIFCAMYWCLETVNIHHVENKIKYATKLRSE